MDAKMLEGKVAIISGASYGMGFSMAEVFAREGAKVIMTARGQEKLGAAVKALRDKGYEVTGVAADNKNLEDVQRVFQMALETYGDLDIVINNAAIGEQKMIDETDDEWLEYVYQTNVFGPFRFIREALKIFLPKNEGCIINISSVWGCCGASCEVAYSATKGGINAFTQALAKELAPSNIQVNAVACGAIDTDMNHFLEKEELEALKEEIPAGRLAKPEEVAQLLLQLARSDSYLTGQIIGFDGGWI